MLKRASVIRDERRLQEGCRNAEVVPATATKLASVSKVPGFLRFSMSPSNLCVVSTAQRAHGESASARICEVHFGHFSCREFALIYRRYVVGDS